MKTKWIELRTNLPIDYNELLVYGTLEGDEAPDIHMVLFYNDTLMFKLCGDSSDRAVLSVQYWMPLPEEPNTEKAIVTHDIQISTAIDFLVHQLIRLGCFEWEDSYPTELIKKAKAMEKEQIVDAFNEGISEWTEKACTDGTEYYYSNFES